MREGTTRVMTCGLLGATALASFLLPDTLTVPANVAAADLPVTMQLDGVVHDFRRNDPILLASGGTAGHHAGTVMERLSGHGRPLFSPGGYRVISEFTDARGRAIAPHLARVRGRRDRGTPLGVRLRGRIDVGGGVIDAFDSNFGPYDRDGNSGADALVSTNSTRADDVAVGASGVIRGDVAAGFGASPTIVIDNKGIITGSMTALDAAHPMPVITVPADPDDLRPHEADGHLVNGSFTLRGDGKTLWHDTLRITDAVVTISGDVRVRCDRKLAIARSRIVLEEGARLTFYVQGDDDVELRSAVVNVDSGDTSAVVINCLGRGTIDVRDGSHLYATILGPGAHLHIDDGHLYGAYVGDALTLGHEDAGLHVDLANARSDDWSFALTVRERIDLDDGSVIDSFDSAAGPYGGANVGGSAPVSTNAIAGAARARLAGGSTLRGDLLVGPGGAVDTVVGVESGSVVEGAVGRLPEPIAIPVVTPPTLGVSAGDMTYAEQTFTVAADFRCRTLRLDHSTMNVDGHVTIRCDGAVELVNDSHVNLLPGSSLTLYVKERLALDRDCTANMNTGDPTRLSIRRTSVGGAGRVALTNGSRLCGRVQGAGTTLALDGGAELFGSFIGRCVEVRGRSAVHVDTAGLRTCVDVGDREGVVGVDGDGGIPSADVFDKWYRGILGVNQATGHAITLARDPEGVYELLSDGFHPVDGRGFGNEGRAHNDFFTYTIRGAFEYAACGGQFVEFTGGDGTWLFIDDRLALDIGGVDPGVGQRIDLDRLDLVDGATYEIRLFYAQRGSAQSVFRLRTNLGISTDRALPGVAARID
jgi:fibro-slime domain-containing protein